MVRIQETGVFSVEQPPHGGVGVVVLSGASRRIVVAGYRGALLPDVLTDPGISAVGAPGGDCVWSLSCAEGIFEFQARGIEQLEARPALFTVLLAPHALTRGERMAARVLLKLLGLPGGPRLLRAWHARRG